jgi:hypothetical protein
MTLYSYIYQLIFIICNIKLIFFGFYIVYNRAKHIISSLVLFLTAAKTASSDDYVIHIYPSIILTSQILSKEQIGFNNFLLLTLTLKDYATMSPCNVALNHFKNKFIFSYGTY